MLQNAYFLAKIGADTAKNERKFAAIFPKTGNYLAVDGRPVESHEDLVDAGDLAAPPRGRLRAVGRFLRF